MRLTILPTSLVLNLNKGGDKMKIKTCPFCGGKTIIYKDDWYGQKLYTIECTDCDAKITRNKKKQAEEAWNKRINENLEVSNEHHQQ